MKKALSISLILVFLIAQYGNILSYVYCKWRAEAMSASCDCEKKYAQETKDPDHPVQVVLKDKSADPYEKTGVVIFGEFSKPINCCFVNRASLLAKGFQSPLLHPPPAI